MNMATTRSQHDVTASDHPPERRLLRQHASLWMQQRVRSAAAASRAGPPAIAQAKVRSGAATANWGLTHGDQLLHWLVTERGGLPQQHVRACQLKSAVFDISCVCTASPQSHALGRLAFRLRSSNNGQSDPDAASARVKQA